MPKEERLRLLASPGMRPPETLDAEKSSVFFGGAKAMTGVKRAAEWTAWHNRTGGVDLARHLTYLHAQRLYI